MAVSAIYDGSTELRVIFDMPFMEPLTGISGRNPTALVQTSTLPHANPNGHTLLVNGVTYRIVGFEPEDDGKITLLQLAT